jgi:hypothetical protein
LRDVKEAIFCRRGISHKISIADLIVVSIYIIGCGCVFTGWGILEDRSVPHGSGHRVYTPIQKISGEESSERNARVYVDVFSKPVSVSLPHRGDNISLTLMERLIGNQIGFKEVIELNVRGREHTAVLIRANLNIVEKGNVRVKVSLRINVGVVRGGVTIQKKFFVDSRQVVLGRTAHSLRFYTGPVIGKILTSQGYFLPVRTISLIV